jgi:hypothetical protein
MADELKTDENTSTQTDGNETTVTMTQAKLDDLINGKFKKGAEKANTQILEELGVENLDSLKAILKAKSDAEKADKTELEKALEAVKTANDEKDELSRKYETVEKRNLLNSIAAKHGVKEVDYFELELNKVERGEDFNIDTFVEGLKTSKPSLFGVTKTANTDTSNNGGNPPEFKDKLKGLTLNELIKLQQSL